MLDISDPQQMNGYAYAGNNPINRADPTGLRDWNAIFHEIEIFTFQLMVFGMCEALVGEAGIFGTMVCGGVAQVAVYMDDMGKLASEKGPYGADPEAPGRGCYWIKRR